jgi:hypothetical protein
MNIRKLLIIVHRWMGITGGVLFVVWFISGIVFMYWTMPTYGNRERLSGLRPIDLSSARVEPMDAAANARIKPTRLRIGMSYDGRPMYRFQGNVNVFADTGERVPGRNAEEAIALVRQLEPANRATVRYEELKDDIDLWTAGGAAAQMPLHKISLGDPAGSYYYVSQKTGEVVMKTDRQSRFWGFLGPVLHQWYFTSLRRNNDLWDKLILWASVLGSLMCLTGLIAGVWMYSVKRGSPYSGWVWWHHYAGLLFGVVTFTWIFSGGLAFNSYGIGNSTNPTPQQRDAATGGALQLEHVTLGDLRKSIDAITPIFMPKEADVLQFRGELYLFAADGPPERQLIGLTEREWSPNWPDYRMVWLKHSERGPFTRFENDTMLEIARDAMPGVGVADAMWLTQYDNYYRSRLEGLSLPVLRARYKDAEETWLYIDPHRGIVAWKEERGSRLRRWLYNGLHKFDFPVIYYGPRPLWDIVVIALSIGGLVLSSTTLLPGFRRLLRHSKRVLRRTGIDRLPHFQEKPASEGD